MTRIKTVYPSDMVCHLWANRHPHYVRTQSENLYTSGKALHSYGSHHVIGAFLDDPAPGGEALILWNTRGHSVTTAKHTTQAFRALSRDQRVRMVYCNGGLNRDNVENRGLPEVARANIAHALGQLEKAIGARSNRDSYVQQAREALEGARKIYLYTGDKKSADSVLALPDLMEKAAIIDTVSAVKKTEYLREAAKYAASAKSALEFTQNRADQYAAWRDAGKPETNQYCAPKARYIIDKANDTLREVDKAAHNYKLAKANPTPTLTRIRKSARDIVALWSDAYKAETASEACGLVLNAARRHLVHIAAFEHNEKHGAGRAVRLGRLEVTRDGYLYRGLDGIAMVSSDDVILAWPDKAQRDANVAIIDRALRRGNSIRAYGKLEAAIGAAMTHCASIKTNFIDGTRPNVGTRPSEESIVSALRKVSTPSDYWTEKANDAVQVTRDTLAQVDVIIAQRNAETIEKWRNGERVSVPYDVPVMARVVDDTVQTSRNVVVPLEHAARLVKIAQRIAARGGMTYAQGTGPIVGHFRVNFIGADMAAIIGCHEFSATETARIMPIIEREAIERGLLSTND